MKHTTLASLSLLALAFAAVGYAFAAEPALPGEILRLDFEEGVGSYCDDAAGRPQSAALTPSARWATGQFGGALACGVTGAGALLAPIPELAGASEATFFVRFRQTGAHAGPHACVVASPRWTGMGGFNLQLAGSALNARLRAGKKGPETSLTAFKAIPENAWCSVAVVFARPTLAVYANGKKVAAGTWDHPLVDAGLSLGCWGENSFGGFVDDFRVFTHALAAGEIATLAGDSRYDEVEGYQDDGTGGVRKTEVVGQNGAPLASSADAFATLAFDSLGRVSSIREKASGRELVTNPVAFARLTLKDGRILEPRKLAKAGVDAYSLQFPYAAGELAFTAKKFDGGVGFTITACTVKDVVSCDFCRIRPAVTKWVGHFANAASDERSAVCVRSGDAKAEPRSDTLLYIRIADGFSPVGRTAYLAAGPRATFRDQLKAMTIAAGVPRSDCGGAWSMESEVARWSYVFAPVLNGDIDYWIELVRRSGFANIHINSSWTSCLGHCPVNPKAFPGGLDQMAACAKKVHDAGLHCGMHSLSACIAPHDSWITPVCREDLVADATYTLARPLAETDTELFVEERPIDRHSTVFTYSSNGNVLRIGGELMRYSGIRRDTKPYAFTGLQRGAFRTKKGGAHPAGTKVDYVHQRYIAFYPKPDSKLMDELAAGLANVYNTCNFDEFYFDGSEGMGTRYGIDAMRRNVYARLKHNNGHAPSIEASCQGANNWWFQTRTATTDHGVYGVKRFHDWHIDWGVEQGRNRNFLEPQMGWWQPRTDVARARGHFLDEMEYFAAKNAGHDAAMSIQGVFARPLPIGVRRQLTVLGWYEYPRLARAFDPKVAAYLAKPRTESRLRQNGEGVWEIEDVASSVTRFGFPWVRSATFGAALEARADLRVEALYHAADAKTGVVLLTAKDFGKMKARANKGVEQSFKAVDGAHGPALALTAKNVAAEPRAAWAGVRRAFDFPGLEFDPKGKDIHIAYGAWVKGDGSGALLNFVLSTPGEYAGGISEHYVRLDFTGWKYVTWFLRERDAARHEDYVWPYGSGYAAIYRNFISTTHIGSFGICLNDIPKGGTAQIEVGEVSTFPQVARTLRQPVVTLNGIRHEVPFDLASGEYAELVDRTWTHYSALGTAIERDPQAVVPASVKEGSNELVWAGKDAADRAEVTVFTRTNRRPAFAAEKGETARPMPVEAVLPFEYAPAKGLFAPKTLAVRPGCKAALEIAVAGPAANPSLTFSGWFGLSKTVCRFPVTIGADEELVCRDGVTWKVRKLADGALVQEGRLEEKLPVLSDSVPLLFAAEVPEGAACEVDLMKRYL